MVFKTLFLMWTILTFFIEFVILLLLCFGFSGVEARRVGSWLPDQRVNRLPWKVKF